jgi:DHA2 family methylenomycin A resistance protein-like MFS transporter
MTAIAVSAVDASRAGMASAVHNAMRQLGQVLGVAVLGALVYANPSLRADAGGRLDPSRRPLFVGGLHHALWASGAALLAAAVLAAVLLPRRAGALTLTKGRTP